MACVSTRRRVGTKKERYERLRVLAIVHMQETDLVGHSSKPEQIDRSASDLLALDTHIKDADI